MLKGERVYLRLMEQRDITLICNMRDDEEMQRYDNSKLNKSEIEFILKNFNKIRKLYNRTLTIVNSRNVIVGSISYDKMNEIEDKVVYSIGITIGRRYWNRGYGKDAVSTLVEYLFNSKGADLIRLEVVRENARAINCYKSVGFEEKYTSEECLGKNIIIMTLEKNNLLENSIRLE